MRSRNRRGDGCEGQNNSISMTRLKGKKKKQKERNIKNTVITEAKLGKCGGDAKILYGNSQASYQTITACQTFDIFGPPA